MHSTRCTFYFLASLALASCGSREGNGSQTWEDLLPVPLTRTTVHELENQQGRHLQRGVDRFYKTDKGWLALERGMEWPAGRPSKTHAFLRSSANSFQASPAPLLSGNQVSDLFFQGSDFSIAAQSLTLENDGRLANELRVTRFSLQAGEPRPEATQVHSFHMDIPVWEKGFDPSPLQQRKKRAAWREAYERSFLIADRRAFPQFIAHSKSVEILVRTQVESGVYRLEKSDLIPLQPLNSDSLYGLKVIPCESDGADTFLFSGKARDFAPYYSDLSDKYSPDAKLLVGFTYGNGGLIPRFEKVLKKAPEFQAWVCTRSGGSLYIGGSEPAEESDESIASLQILEASGEARAVTLRLPQLSFISALAIDPLTHEIYAGGSYGFYQAHGGSVSYMTGFVAGFRSDLTAFRIQSLEGRRTTRVLALALENEQVLVGGMTDAPATHDAQVTSKSFIQTFLRKTNPK